MNVDSFLESIGLGVPACRTERVGNCTLILSDCRTALIDLLADETPIHACVTDPPYELGFMGKAWDRSGIANDVGMWADVLAALLPGAHLLSFGGTRTYHRMACAIEDAGFDIRDQVMWIYGSGFPKSLDISKAIDKAAGAKREKRITGKPGVEIPATPEAEQWDGWGTSLKPAHEPICVGRKPLSSTNVSNVLTHGVGAINIDGCRVDAPEGRPLLTNETSASGLTGRGGAVTYGAYAVRGSKAIGSTTLGRFPANVIHDGSEEVLSTFPTAPGQLADASTNTGRRKTQNVYGTLNYGSRRDGELSGIKRGDEGNAARFFYCAKASKQDRGEGNIHPTVKPSALMRYLCRLVTPPGGTVLDPFMGSGSTGAAAVREGFHFIGIERDEAYFEIALQRIQRAVREANA